MLSGHLEPVEARAGRELYHHGDAPDSLYVLMRGRVELRFPRRRAARHRRAGGAGSLLGDQSFLTTRRRPAAAHVVADALLYRLSREAWDTSDAAERRDQAPRNSAQHRADAPANEA